jgi:transposase
VKYFAGLDVSMEETAMCVVDELGAIVREGVSASDPEALSGWLSGSGLELERIGLEAGPLSEWLFDGLRAVGLRAICIETRRMKGASAAMAVKTDRGDARLIAQAMRVGWYRAVHVKSETSRVVRLLLGNRRRLVEQRVALDNGMRGALKPFGIKVGPVSEGRFAARVRALLSGRAELLALIEPMLAVRATLRAQIKVLHRRVLALVRASALCRQLMTVPGVGAVVALSVVSGIDDPKRFRRARAVGAHFGLTPRKYASGAVDRNGGISKAGDDAVRAALFQAAHTMLTRSQSWSALKAWAMRVAKRRGLRRATAALARKLAGVLWRMWTDGTAFRAGAKPA